MEGASLVWKGSRPSLQFSIFGETTMLAVTLGRKRILSSKRGTVGKHGEKPQGYKHLLWVISVLCFLRKEFFFLDQVYPFSFLERLFWGRNG